MPANALHALDTVMVRAFAVLRVLNVVVLVGYVIVWWSWYAEHPAGLAAAVVTAAWGVVFVVVCLTRQALPRRLVAGNVALAIVTGAGAVLWLPPDSVGGFGTWVFSTATHAAVVAAAVYGRRTHAVVVAAMVAALLGGAAVAQATLDDPALGGNHTPLKRVVIGVVLLAGLAQLFRLAVARLRAIALDADARLTTAAAEQEVATVAAARLRDERERERVLHDTVLNTLTGIAWGGGAPQDGSGGAPVGPGHLTGEQCRHAIEAVRSMLDGTAAGTRDLAQPMRRVVAVARARGLRVDVRALPTTDLPDEVVAALAGSAQELLANVRRHAGTDRAALEVRWRRADGAVTVIVSDEGIGFAARAVPGDRLGLARSVHARMTEIGGQATITSEPGRGTTARLTWSGGETGGGRPAGHHAARPASRRPAHRRGMRPRPRGRWAGYRWTAVRVASRARSALPGRSAAQTRTASRVRVPAGTTAAELRDSYAAGLRRTVAAVTAIWFTSTVFVLVLVAPSSRSVPAAVLHWLSMALVVLPAAWTAYRRPLRRAEAIILMVLALAVTAAVGFNIAPTHTDAAAGTGGPPSRISTWPVLILPLLLALLAVSRLFVEWIVAIAATVTVLDLLVLRGAGTGPLALAQLLTATNGQIAIQVMVSMGGPLLRRTADQVARAVEAETAQAAAARSTAAIRQDRARGLATVEREVLPLLEAVADGLLDPGDPAVRERCGRHATAVRRALVTGATGALGSLAEPVFEARARGLDLEVQVVGEAPWIPARVSERLAAVLPGLLRAVPAAGAEHAVLTLICEEGDGRLFLTYPAAAPPELTALTGIAGGEVFPVSEVLSVSADADDGQVCVEVAWSAGREVRLGRS
ncbi:putative signal transduction histidine kinase [Parafrankia sp. Ea1.12]|uniref:ATP-binding protein n=1 Tax=Parafrankia sp. Ea1.12 TaxID=573499 RepID=UPI000DA43473|nr:ATP-binding protein [Parafrankia sp. Ea1.12]SQE00014.1 putative signal transduction histidine kinase [Parafrankia sp. Ea1.12]